MLFAPNAQFHLATQQERPMPWVGHGKHVPRMQLTTKLRTSGSKNESCKQKIAVVDVRTLKEDVNMMH